MLLAICGRGSMFDASRFGNTSIALKFFLDSCTALSKEYSKNASIP